MREPLPRIRIPLDAEDPDAVIDLQAIFTQCYDMRAYARDTDYATTPEPPLKGNDMPWAEQRLSERGLRSRR